MLEFSSALPKSILISTLATLKVPRLSYRTRPK